jgi:hypothetical protein
MRVVAFDAIAHRRRMHGTFQRSCIFVSVTADAERLRTRRRELDPRDVLVGSDFMAGQTSHGDSRVHELALGFVFVTLDTRGGIGFRVKRYGVDRSEKLYRAKKHKPQAQENLRNQVLPRSQVCR